MCLLQCTYAGPAQLPRPPRPWPDHFFSTCNFLRMCYCTWHFEFRTCRRGHDIMALSKQVTVIYPVISAKPHKPVSFELDLRIDFAYSVNLNFSLLCAFVYINQLLMSALEGPHLTLKLTRSHLWGQKFKNLPGGPCPQTPLEITYCTCDTQSQLAWPLKSSFLWPWYVSNWSRELLR